LLITIIFTTQNSYAALDYGVGRVRTCNAEGEPEGLDFNPTYGGDDIEFVVTNPVCLTVIATSYFAVKGAITGMNYACGTGSAIPRVKPSPLMDSWDIGKATIKGPRTASCISTTLGAVAALGTAIAEIAVIYGIAERVYDNTSLCGADWVRPNPKTFSFSTPGYKQTVQNKMNEWLRDGDNEDKFRLDDSGEKMYREWYYGGVEVVDNPDSGEVCYDPTTRQTGPYPRQKYYMKGTEAANFDCKKYFILEGKNDPAFTDGRGFSESRLLDFRTAYDCCTKRSRDYICLSARNITEGYLEDVTTAGLVDYDLSKTVFCKAGTNCTIDGITYTSRFMDSDRLICAETYSLCPYNFSIGGGTEYCDYYRDGIYDGSRWDMITVEEVEKGQCVQNSEIRNGDCTYNEKAGQCMNYCQYLTHCTKTSYINPYVSGLTSPYFSEACLNFEGDSQNKAGFNGGIVIGNQKHFSTPIAQCVKETLENVFYNRAGHSKCLNINEYPSKNGECPSGQYVTNGNFVHKKGNKVQENSFFETIQNNLQFAVKLVLTFSIMLYGMNLLLWKTDIRNKKDILMYILKIALVLYFATGDAWQSMFFNGVYSASTEFSRMVFKIKTDEDEQKRDGCQFGRVYLKDGTETYSDRLYPPGKEYLSIWDTLDCKIMRYLAFGPQASTAGVISLILAAYFTGTPGLYFALSGLIFAMLLIAATIRALHIFLSSAIAIIIMVFVSPIIIPLALFEKTKSIFDNWVKELISFCLQPMILFAYIAIFIMVIDQTLIGSASYSGNPPFKTINCQKRCVDSDGNIVRYNGDQSPACDQNDQKIINPMNDSVACLLDVNSFGKFPGLEILGLSIPIVINLFSEHVKDRILTLLKGVLVMYLMYKFMDEIPGITSSLIGGTKLPTSNADGLAMFKGTLGIAKQIQKRVARGLQKHGGKAAGKIREGISSRSSKGKQQGDASGESGSDSSSGGKKIDGIDSGSSDTDGPDSSSGGGGNGNDSSA
jgi:type IV secretory pathway VirB6-like protein